MCSLAQQRAVVTLWRQKTFVLDKNQESGLRNVNMSSVQYLPWGGKETNHQTKEAVPKDDWPL